MRRSVSLTIITTLIVGLVGCDTQSASDPSEAKPGHSNASKQPPEASRHSSVIRLKDVTASSGVEFTYRNGEEAGNYSILESLGGGVALLDFDGDHKLDLFLPGGGHFPEARTIAGLPAGLFRHRDTWQFENVSLPAGADSAPMYSHGANVGDYDQDGFADVLVTGYGRMALFHNNGDGTFHEAAEAAGLVDTQWSSSSAWADFNNDGALDVYVAHYVNWSFDNNPECPSTKPGQREVCPPRRFDPLPDTLYLSQADGTFRDASMEFALRKDGKGLGVVAGDLDLDGHVDVYVGNDTVPNFLYRNTGTKFEDMGLMSGTSLSDRGTPDGSMGVDMGDFNQDGLPDIWVANFESESFALYRNQGNFFFQHISQPMGVTAVGALYVGWGTVFMDMDRDGDLDVFCSNGHVIRHPVNAPLKQNPLVFENQTGQRFVNVAPSAGEYTSTPHMGRGCALGDVDDDGDLDLVVVHTNEPAALLSNESESQSHWLSIRLIGRQSNRDAIGAIVRIQPAGGKEIVSQIKSGSSYASSSDKRVFFGLGTANRVERVSIRWPSGVEQNLDSIDADVAMTVIESRAEN